MNGQQRDVVLTVRITREQHGLLVEQARLEDRSQAQLVRRALDAYLRPTPRRRK